MLEVLPGGVGAVTMQSVAASRRKHRADRRLGTDAPACCVGATASAVPVFYRRYLKANTLYGMGLRRFSVRWAGARAVLLPERIAGTRSAQRDRHIPSLEPI
jgi:hypothetical protein